jgi:hypothetical protein
MTSAQFSPYELTDLRDGYRSLVEAVRSTGRKREARGFVTYDVADACFTVLNTDAVLPVGVGRDPKAAIGYAEALQLIGGFESPSLVSSVSPTFRRFMDGGALAGSYGPLTRAQMPCVVETLRQDRDSRQAVVQVHPGLQNVQGLRDVPCTINLGFELRSDGLHMRATMRSNDVWLGLAYDAFQFCQLGWSVANVFSVPLASYTHHAYSLHLYERDVDKVDRLHAYELDPLGRNEEPHGFDGRSWSDVRRQAEWIYENPRAHLEGKFLSESDLAYLEALEPYTRTTRTEGFSA